MEPSRYVSLCPSVTETLFELGVGHEVVGITRFCVHPRDGVAGVERIGGTKDPRVHKILELEPTLVFANEEENRLEDVESLRNVDLTVHTSFPRRVDDVPAVVRDIGRRVDRVDRAEDLARSIERAAAEARAAAVGRSRVGFVALIWRSPWMGAAEDTFMSDVLTTVGGVNLLVGHPARYPEVTFRTLRELDPEVVLLPSEPFPFRETHLRELASESGLPRERFRLCDGQLLTWHGARTLEALRTCGAWLQ